MDTAQSGQYKTVFISHSTPEDNYSAGWLASKLRLLGYTVWCDLEQLKGGEDFWQDIERTIRNTAVKFLFVISKVSLEKRGTLKELAVADNIRNRGDFIIPLRFEDVPYASLPAEIIRLTAIDFSVNWADGLNQLLEKLEKDEVSRTNAIDSEQIFQSWQMALSISDNVFLNREERYLSNWFEYSLPPAIYLHKPSDIREIDVLRLPYPTVIEDGYLLTFACSRCVAPLSRPMSSEKISVTDFLENEDFDSPHLKISVIDARKKVIELLNQAFTALVTNKGLVSYPMSEDVAYYFPKAAADKATDKVSLKKYGRKWIQLAGTTGHLNWHLALQGRSSFYPFSAFNISYHVVFTTQNGIPVNPAIQHRRRRHVRWYNKKWRDLLLGAMLRLSSEESSQNILIPVCCNQNVTLSNVPISFISPQGYAEPQ